MTTLDVLIGTTGEAERKAIATRVTDARGVLLKRFENDITTRLQRYAAAQTRLRASEDTDADVLAQLNTNSGDATTRFETIIATIPR